MREFGIIGFPLTHSASPDYFNSKFKKEGLNAIYHSLPIDTIFKIHPLIKNYPFLYGFNVTSPYKQEIIPHLHKLDKTAKVINAVNVVKVVHTKETTELIGYNTDAGAFSKALTESWDDSFSKALIFGTGGAAQAVRYALEQLGIAVQLVSRTKQGTTLTYEEITPSLIKEYPLLINATPVGMYPGIDKQLPLPYEAIGPSHFMIDLIYNPIETLFLAEGKQRGAKIMNGKRMFELQAEMGWEIWNDQLFTSHP